MRRRGALMSAFAAGLALASPAGAAPFCADITGIPPQCIYEDVLQCQQYAQRQGGQCSANRNELKLEGLVGQFCLVSPSRASQCVFPDRATCYQAAARSGGACVPATPGPDNSAEIDPFRVRRPY